MADNKFFVGDCLYVLNGLNSETVDLVYADPPYRFKRVFSSCFGTKPGSVAQWSFRDVDYECLWTVAEYPALVTYLGLLNSIHSKQMSAYVTFMAQRIIQMHRVLKDTGSIYLHCPVDTAPYVKPVLDIVFGFKNHRTEIAWRYRGGGLMKGYFEAHDTILHYSKSSKYAFNKSVKKSDVIDVGHLSPMSNERTGYPCQKPIKLLTVLIEASSKKGDIVLDPFSGNGTTALAAQMLGRGWVSIDIESTASDMMMHRLANERVEWVDFTSTDMIPVRSDVKEHKLDDRDLMREVFARQDGGCSACGRQNIPLKMCHRTPFSKARMKHKDNISMRCESCIRSQHDPIFEKISGFKV